MCFSCFSLLSLTDCFSGANDGGTSSYGCNNAEHHPGRYCPMKKLIRVSGQKGEASKKWLAERGEVEMPYARGKSSRRDRELELVDRKRKAEMKLQELEATFESSACKYKAQYAR